MRVNGTVPCDLSCMYRYTYSYADFSCDYEQYSTKQQNTPKARAKNNVRTTVNFRANDGKDRSNDYTSGHYDRPGEYSAL